MTFSPQKYSNTFVLSNMKSMSFVKTKNQNLSTETKLFISCKFKQLTKQRTKSTESRFFRKAIGLQRCLSIKIYKEPIYCSPQHSFSLFKTLL